MASSFKLKVLEVPPPKFGRMNESNLSSTPGQRHVRVHQKEGRDGEQSRLFPSPLVPKRETARLMFLLPKRGKNADRSSASSKPPFGKKLLNLILLKNLLRESRSFYFLIVLKRESNFPKYLGGPVHSARPSKHSCQNKYECVGPLPTSHDKTWSPILLIQWLILLSCDSLPPVCNLPCTYSNNNLWSWSRPGLD